MGSGYIQFTATVLTAADVNDYLMEQSVMSFASTGARDTQITAPEEGMVAVLTADDLTTIYNGTSWVRFVQYGAGTAYTPALTASTTNPSLGTGGFPETTGRYSQNGKIVTGYARVAAGTTSVTAGSGTYRISLPVTCAMDGVFDNRGVVVGSAYYSDSSAPTVNYVATAFATDGGTYAIFRTVGGVISSTLPGLAASDFIGFNFTYTAA
jgi:hypothetical protein